MLKWLQGERRGAGSEPLVTDDPLATITGRGRPRRPHEPVYGVTRVNPLFREGPNGVGGDPGAQDLSLGYSRPYWPAVSPPGSPQYARPVSADGSAPGGDLDTERLSVTSVGPVRRPPRTPPLPPPPPPLPPPPPPPRRTARHLYGSLAWAGLDVLVMDNEYVSGLAVNLARSRHKALGEQHQSQSSRQRAATNAPARCRPPPRSTLVTNPDFVKGVLVATVGARPATCPQLVIKTNPDFVLVISTKCRHTKSVLRPVSTDSCPSIKVDKNANYVKRITANCRHTKTTLSPGGWCRPVSVPSFELGAPSQALCRSPPPVHDWLQVPSPARGPSVPADAAPDSIVTDSLLLLTSPDPSPAATLHARPLTPADLPMPDHVLAEFSQALASSRSVSMVRRAGSDASSANTLTSQGSRSSGRPDREQVAAPLTFVTSLWERTGLRTNGRRLLVNDDLEDEEAGSGRGSGGGGSGGRTPSPSVPARLPLSQSWLQRLAELPGLRPPEADTLTAVVVQAPPPPSDRSASSERHVTFTPGASAAGRPGPSLSAPPSDHQRLWNTYYGADAGAGSGYGALEPRPPYLQEMKRAAVLHDRKFSEFTLDVSGASALRQRAEARRRSRRRWRAAVVLLVLAALLACIMLVSWYCTKGRHLFGVL